MTGMTDYNYFVDVISYPSLTLNATLAGSK